MTYDEARDRLAAALEGAARSHRGGLLNQIDSGYDELDGLMPRGDDSRFAKLHIALHFWDGWADSRNHDWMYYKGVSKGDWPVLAEVIVADLRADREIQNETVLRLFDFRRSKFSGVSLWDRMSRFLSRGE